MKALLAFFFFFAVTLILGYGCWMAAAGHGVWLLLIGVLAYTVMFVRLGCQTE